MVDHNHGDDNGITNHDQQVEEQEHNEEGSLEILESWKPHQEKDFGGSIAAAAAFHGGAGQNACKDEEGVREKADVQEDISLRSFAEVLQEKHTLHEISQSWARCKTQLGPSCL